MNEKPRWMAVIALGLLLQLLAGCGFGDGDSPPAATPRVACSTDDGLYAVNRIVTVSCFLDAGQSASIAIKSISDRGASPEIVETLSGRGATAVQLQWTAPAQALGKAYEVAVLSQSLEAAVWQSQTFFRVGAAGALTTFAIGRVAHRDHPVFLLRGGLSAEYALEKALANLAGGTAHSWQPGAPGSGPEPVLATPGFLEKSLAATVAAYDRYLGAEARFETVIISTGFPSIPYFSHALGAPVLPIHFLVSVDSVKEIELILDRAGDKGLSAYSTLGHDTSLPLAVAWIKLLDLPRIYADFINRHGAKNVLILGSTGAIGGETKARMVLNGSSEPYRPQSIYILYPGTSPDDEATLNREIADLTATPLGEFEYISDWESGITSIQMDNFRRSVERQTAAGLTVVSAENLITLYNLGTYAALALMHKNAGLPGARTPTGIALNPYLIGYPAYEHWQGYVPYVYWQGNPPASIAAMALETVTLGMQRTFPGIDVSELEVWMNSTRNFGGYFAPEHWQGYVPYVYWQGNPPASIAAMALETVTLGMQRTFPGIDVSELEVWMNSTRNFGGYFAPPIARALSDRGMASIRENDYSLDENWDLGDGLNSASEAAVRQIVTAEPAARFEAWRRALVLLELDEFLDVARWDPDIDVVEP